MLFKPELAAKIPTGEKTQTRRIVKDGEFIDTYEHRDKTVKVVYLPNGHVKWMTGKFYAIQTGRGQKAIGRFRLLDIRRQRVGDISETDAIAEGVDRNCPGDWQSCPACWSKGKCQAEGEYIHYLRELDTVPAYSAVESFASLWNSINTAPGQRWQDNPKVWVLTFEYAGEGYEHFVEGLEIVDLEEDEIMSRVGQPRLL